VAAPLLLEALLLLVEALLMKDQSSQHVMEKNQTARYVLNILLKMLLHVKLRKWQLQEQPQTKLNVDINSTEIVLMNGLMEKHQLIGNVLLVDKSFIDSAQPIQNLQLRKAAVRKAAVRKAAL
jgi:hypothetical protein